MEISRMTIEDLEEIKDILENEFDDFWNTNILRSEILKENSYYIVCRSENQIVRILWC